ncbi:MAG: DegV family protein [Clostridia bacterium]|nr:DegV family protein [Clostridia bacterium]
MIGLVTDTLSCLSEQDCIENDVYMVQAGCCINGTRFSDAALADTVSFPEDSRSLAPTATDFFKAFGALFERVNEIICISYSKKMGLSYNNATVASLGYKNRRITVLDCGSAVGAVLILVKMCRDLEKSGAGYADIVKILSAQADRINAYFTLSSLDEIKRAVKINIPQGGSYATILNRRPFCMINGNGEIELLKLSDGKVGAIADLISKVKSPRKMVCCYSDEEPMVYELKKSLQEKFPDVPLDMRKVSASVKVNLGGSALGLFTLEE